MVSNQQSNRQSKRRKESQMHSWREGLQRKATALYLQVSEGLPSSFPLLCIIISLTCMSLLHYLACLHSFHHPFSVFLLFCVSVPLSTHSTTSATRYSITAFQPPSISSCYFLPFSFQFSPHFIMPFPNSFSARDKHKHLSMSSWEPLKPQFYMASHFK